jgi:hypothetical protein
VTLDDLRALYVHPEGDFLSVDSMAVELEVAELLYALVRQSKPNVVVECGSGKGYASRFIAEGLADNDGDGRLFTYEQDHEYAEQAQELLRGLPATVVVNYSHDNPPNLDPDLVFIDSLGGEPRERDMDHWFACAARPLIVIHDASHYPPETFARGEGVLLQAGRGVWIGRARA